MRRAGHEHGPHARSGQTVGVGDVALDGRAARTDGDLERGSHRSRDGKAVVQHTRAGVADIFDVAVFRLALHLRAVGPFAHVL